LPAGHVLHRTAPPGAKVPALHDAQLEEGSAEPAAHALPAPHVQLMHLLIAVPPGENWPAAQVEHDNAPVSGAYFPAGQAVHWAPFPAGEN
jgi:hypothetical protein